MGPTLIRLEAVSHPVQAFPDLAAVQGAAAGGFVQMELLADTGQTAPTATAHRGRQEPQLLAMSNLYESIVLAELNFEPRLVPIPIETLDFNIFRRTLRIPLDEGELEEAPSLDKDTPAQVSPDLRQEINDFYK